MLQYPAFANKLFLLSLMYIYLKSNYLQMYCSICWCSNFGIAVCLHFRNHISLLLSLYVSQI